MPLPYQLLADYTRLRCRKQFVALFRNKARMSAWETPMKTLISTETDGLVSDDSLMCHYTYTACTITISVSPAFNNGSLDTEGCGEDYGYIGACGG